MGLIAYTSQNYQTLLEQWVQNVFLEQKSRGVHETQTVVPQHRIANWLNRSLAQRLGISMNHRFQYMESMVESWTSPDGGSTNSTTNTSTLQLQWASILWQGLISGELESPTSSQSSSELALTDLQWMQLAWEYAGMLLIYCENRPLWFERWRYNNGFPLKKDDHVRFQENLFNYLNQKGAFLYPLTANPSHDFNITAENDDSPLHIFGFWRFSQSHWVFINALSHHKDIYLYQPFPTQSYVADITKSTLQKPLLLGDDGVKMGPNYQLLSKLGQRARALQMLLLDHGVEMEEQFLTDPKKSNDTNLNAIQLQACDPEHFDASELKLTHAKDASIQIHSVCSPRREVEVVKAAIQKGIIDSPELKLEEIHVAAPDIELYRHLIEEIFSGSDETEPSLDYSIHHSVDADQVPSIKAAMDGVSLLKSDWNKKDILNWLSRETILRAFELTPNDIKRIQYWLNEAGIFEGNPTQSHTEISSYHCWELGMERLLQAYSGELEVNPLGECGFDSGTPGQNSEVFFKFCKWYDFMVQAANNVAKQPHSPDYMRGHLSRFFSKVIPTSNEFEKQVVLTAINRVVSHFQGKHIDLATFHYLLKKSLPKLPSPNTMSRKSGIQFSSIQFEDIIPCKIRIIMGMNESDFPSAELPKSHNLLQQSDNEPSDPSRKEDQRYWILQSIHQTEDQWIVTYQGQDSAGENSRLLSPSVEAVTASVNQIRKGRGQPIEILQHTRFAYDAECFAHHSPIGHFSSTNFKIASNLHLTREFKNDDTESFDVLIQQKTSEGLPDETTTWDLARFFVHPNRYICQKNLGIQFPQYIEFQVEHEPLLWMGMPNMFALQTDLLRSKAKGFDTDRLSQILRTHHLSFSKEMDGVGVEAVVGSLGASNKIPSFESIQLLESSNLGLATINVSGLQITHLVIPEPVSETVRIATVKSSNLKATHKLEAWIQMLPLWAAQSSEHRRNFVLVTKDQTFEICPPENPIEILESLVGIFCNYQNQPMPFFPATSEIFSKGKHPIETISQTAAWKGEYGEKHDPYTEYVFRNKDPFQETFETLSLALFEPLNLHTVKTQKGGRK